MSARNFTSEGISFSRTNLLNSPLPCQVSCSFLGSQGPSATSQAWTLPIVIPARRLPASQVTPFCVVPARNLGLLPGSLFSVTPHPISHHENLTNSPPSCRSDHPVLSILTSVTSLSRTTDPHTGFLPPLTCSNQHSLSPE